MSFDLTRYTLKPFSDELAEAGAPVCTREGLPVSITTILDTGPEFPVIGIIDDSPSYSYWTIKGGYNGEYDHSKDLFHPVLKPSN